MDSNSSNNLRRWRLILGRYASQPLSHATLSSGECKTDQALEYLYGREYDGRGVARAKGGGGSLDPSQLKAIDWLNRSRKLFPREVFERMQSQAVERYQLTELLNDPDTLRSMDASPALAKALLGMRGRLSAGMRDAVREVIQKTVDEITRKLRNDFVNALVGRRNRQRRSLIPNAQNFDARANIAANLKNYSAVVAGIMSSLPSVRVKLVVFDTSVVDLTHLAHDPVEVLLTVQLGGGTDIGRAVQYCESLISNPQRTVFTLISDFEEGASPAPLLAAIQRMAEARVKLLGLAALDEGANPIYDERMAQRLADRGMHVAALTPTHFAQWLAEVMN